MSWMVAAAVRWAMLAGLYLVLAGEVSRAEIAAALFTGGAAAGLSLLLRRSSERRFDLRLPWVPVLGRMLWSLARDVARVHAALVGTIFARRRGRLLHVRTEDVGGTRHPGRRAVEVLTRSIAPNEYVVDDEGTTLLVHRLAGAAGPGEEPLS